MVHAVDPGLAFNRYGRSMESLIADFTTDTRMSGLERFLQRYLGLHRPEFGISADELRALDLPAPLQRFFRFAGRWPASNPQTPYVNRFCTQDQLCGVARNRWTPLLQNLADRLVFVRENQDVWVAATEHTGDDPPVWITEECSHRQTQQVWRQLEKPLSHFLVSFILQELTFGSELLAVAPSAIETFEKSGLSVEPVWIRGEYACEIDRPSYFFVGERFLVRRAPKEADGEDWYGSNDVTGAGVLRSLGLPTECP